MEISWLEYALLANDVYDAPPKLLYEQNPIREIPNLMSSRWGFNEQIIKEINLAKSQIYQKTRLSRIKTSLIARGWESLHDYSAKTGDGFFARLYGNKFTGNTVIAYRGSLLAETENIVADVKLWLKKPSSMLEKARDFFNLVKHKFEDFQKSSPNPSRKIYFTGHSLGGYLAQYAAIWRVNVHDQVKAVVFNAPKLGGFEDEYVHYVDPHSSYPYIINIDVDYEVIHTIGAPIGIQHILHGDDRCSPDFITQLLRQPNPFPNANLSVANGQMIYCLIHEHSMANMSKIVSVVNEVS